MAIHRRYDQEETTPFEGGKMLILAGDPTGATMATVGDLTVQAGVRTEYHYHPNSEESLFIVEGEMEFRIGESRFHATSGDCVMAQQGIGHGMENVGDYPARIITVYPTAYPQRQPVGEPQYIDSDPGPTVFVRGEVEPFEFFAGITRYDMVGDFLGASSTSLSELTFGPGSIAPNHFHPSHEESMFCLEGTLTAVYGDDNNVPLSAGDCFTCEVGVRHGLYNTSDAPATLLAIHPVLNPVPRIDVD